MDDKSTSIADLRSMMARFVAERNWEDFHTPKNLAGSVSIEAAELLELFQWLTPEEAVMKSISDAAFREKLGDEISDVILYLLSLSNAVNLDIADCIEKKLQKNRIKYPAQTCT